MKRILNLAAVAMFAIGASSCADDATEIQGDNLENLGGNKLTFVLPNTQSMVTYSQNDVLAETAEKTIDLDATQIFMFDATSEELEAIINGSAATQGDLSGNKTLTIDIDENWTGGKKFYLVANTATATELPTDITPVVSEEDFLDQVTVSQGTTPLATPLLMTGVEAVTDIETASSVNLTVRRSVARFDIANDVATTNVTIQSVHIENANLQGYVMGYERSNTKDNSEPVEICAAAKGDLNITTILAPDADDDAANADLQSQKSAFYLYPVELKATPTGTDAVMRVSVKMADGSTQLFAVNKVNTTTGDKEDLTIEANRRYKLSATVNAVTGTLMFTIEMSDWDEGDNVVGTPGAGIAGGFAAGTAVAGANASFHEISKTFIVETAGKKEMTFGVMSSSSKGSVLESVDFSTANGMVDYTGKISVELVSTDNTVTYATPYFKSTFKITIEDGIIDVAEPFFATIKVKDVTSGLISPVVKVSHTGTPVDGSVIYPESGLPAVLIGDLYWAPTNVGATDLYEEGNTAISIASTGVYLQWGRNVPFDPWAGSISFIEGPLSASVAASTDAFIYSPEKPHKWLDTDDVNAWVNSSPCPAGWRMPTGDEFTNIILPLYNPADAVSSQSFWKITTGDGDELYFPRGGNMKNSSFIDMYIPFTMGYYWSSTVLLGEESEIIHAQAFDFSHQKAEIANLRLAGGLNVRCVKDAN